MREETDSRERIKAMRQKTGKSQSKFAQYFDIPVRTLQAWETGRTNPPGYIPGMMERILKLEEKIETE